MRFVQVEDGTWLNLDHIVEINVIENSDPLLEEDRDSHVVLLTRMVLHEEHTYILVTGSRDECEREVRRAIGEPHE